MRKVLVGAGCTLLAVVLMGAAYNLIKISGTIYTEDSTLIGDGTQYVVKAVPDCDDTGGNHLNYDTGTNTLSCGTSGAGGGLTQSTGTFEATWSAACDTTPSQTWNYTKTGDAVTLFMVDNVSCTADSAAMATGVVVPADIRPVTANAIMIGVIVQDNGTLDTLPACLLVTTSGAMQMNRSVTKMCDGGNWTNSGTRTVRNAAAGGVTAFSYSIN